MSRDSGTRSGLLWEVERILKEIVADGGELPQILFMENVPQVHAKKNMADFQEWIDFLSSIGYSSKYKDLNSKNFGVAQNRNRTFMVSFLNEDANDYEFPVEIPLKKRMKDYLEDKVEDKYYITSEKAKVLIDKLILDGKILTNERTNERTNEQQSILALKTQESTKSQTVSVQDMTKESQIERMREVAYANGVDLTTKDSRIMDCCSCLTVRYDAGICKHKLERTGVIEYMKILKGRINMKEMIKTLKELLNKMLHNTETEDLFTDEEIAALKEVIRMLEDGDYR